MMPATIPELAPPWRAGQTKAQERRIQRFTLVGHTITHLYMTLLWAVLPSMQAEFGLTVVQITFQVSLANQFFGYGAGPAGWLSTRCGDRPLLCFFFLGAAAGGGLIAVAQNLATLSAGMVLLGLATSIYHPVGISLLSKSASRSGPAMGLNGLAGSLGVGLAPLFAAAILGPGLSWRWAFALPALPMLLLGIMLCLTDLGPAAAPSQATFAPGSRLSPRMAVGFALLLLAFGCAGVNFHMSQVLLPSHFIQAGVADTLARANLWLGPALCIGGLSQFVSGLLAERIGHRSVYLVCYALAAPAIALVGQASGGSLWPITTLAFLFLFAFQPLENTIIASLTPRAWRGTIFGLKFILVFGIGGYGSWLGGVVKARGEFSTVYWICAGFVAAGVTLAAAALSLLRPKNPSHAGVAPNAEK